MTTFFSIKMDHIERENQILSNAFERPMETTVPIGRHYIHDHNSYSCKPQLGEQALTDKEQRFLLNAMYRKSVSKIVKKIMVGKLECSILI